MAGTIDMSALAAPYMIYRPDPTDPTSPPVFYPPKDSDELFDALRQKYPHVRSHADRMRDAIIEFLLEEQHAVDQIMASTSAAQTPMTSAVFTSPMEQNWQFMSSEASTLSSPETLGLATPPFGTSPMPHPAHLYRQASTATAMSSNAPSPPALENMTSVFSLTSSSQPKQRVRRKMTEAEKAEYRTRRIVKACEKCSKRKRKCTHNQPEMESMASKTKVNKTRPNISPPNGKIAKHDPTRPAIQHSNGEESYTLTDPLIFDNYTPPFGEDLAFFNDDLVPDINFDDPLLFDIPMQCGAHHENFANNRGYRFLDQQLSPHGTGIAQFNSKDADDTGAWSTYEQYSGEQGESYGDQSRSAEQGVQLYPTKLQSNPSAQSSYQSVVEADNFGERSNMPASATHTAHVHNQDAQGSFVFDNEADVNSGAAGPQCPRTALAQIVLRLVGTTKAIRAFRNLLPARFSSSPAVSMTRVMGLVAGASAMQLHGSMTTDGFLLDSSIGVYRERGSIPSNTGFAGIVDSARMSAASHLDDGSPESVFGGRILSSRMSERILSSRTTAIASELSSTSSLLSRPSSSEDKSVVTEGWPDERSHYTISQDSSHASPSLTVRRSVPTASSGVGILRPDASALGRPPYAVSSSGIPLPLLPAMPDSSARDNCVDTSVHASRSTYRDLATSNDTASSTSSDSPVHTRPRDPTCSGCSGDADKCFGCGAHVLASGRNERESWQAVPVCLAVMCGLLVASQLTPADASLSWLLLAFLVFQDSPSGHWFQGWSDILNCTIKNSSWLSGQVSREAWTWDIHPKQPAKALPSDNISWHDKGIELGWSGMRWVFSL